MNDIYVVAFILISVGTYLKSREQDSVKWLLLSGIATGLAVSTKWSGLFILGMIATWEIGRVVHEGWRWSKRIPLLLATYLLLPAIIYVASYGQFWIQGHTLSQFKELHQQIWWYQTNLEATHSYQSRAWEWPLVVRPVWYWVDYNDGFISNIYNLANPLLAWLGLVAILLAIFRLPWTKSVPGKLLSSRVWLIAYAWTWMPWLASPRIMFFYHYTPAIPFLAIALADQLVQIQTSLKNGHLILIGAVGLVAIAFAWLLPMWVGWPLPESWWPWLFWLPSWK
jgi:dolichyl-phosphate-mannose--protein O-mannosyl transferase